MKADAYSAQLADACRFLRRYERFLVVSHINPDGDAIGSTLAVGEILRLMGKQAILVNEGAIPGKFSILAGSDRILNFTELGKESIPPFDAVIAVDCADFYRIGAVATCFPEHVPLLNIDHHPTNDGYGETALLKPDAAATAEVLYDLVQELGIEPSPELAQCIYAGLMTDTGGFRYSSTTSKVMAIASEMLAKGVNGNELAEELLEKLTYPQILLLQRALSSLTFSADRRIAWMIVTEEDIAAAGARNEDMEGLVNYPRNIEGVEVGLLFKQTRQGELKVSFRSAGKVDVSRVAKHFGGGGHILASGCSVTGELDTVVGQIVREVELALP